MLCVWITKSVFASRFYLLAFLRPDGGEDFLLDISSIYGKIDLSDEKEMRT